MSQDAVGAAYSVAILLPDEIEAQLERWARVTPGATWPAWGGHITLLSRFSPVAGVEAVRRQIALVCRAFAPFPFALRRVISERHWSRPGQAVLLVGAPEPAVTDPIMRLRSALAEALASWKHDLHPEISRQPFAPHLSLTIGLPKAEAERLTRIAAGQRLAVEFVVQTVWLLKMDLTAAEDDPLVIEKEPFNLRGRGAQPPAKHPER